ncbi:MAG: hypothetical protein ACTSWY_07455 [Promethearchaeota archaeon]
MVASAGAPGASYPAGTLLCGISKSGIAIPTAIITTITTIAII